MRKKKSSPRLRYSLKDKKAIAEIQRQIDPIFGKAMCKKCGRSFDWDIMEIDHIKPISKGGGNQPSNLQLLCPSCNRRKSAKISSKPIKSSSSSFNEFVQHYF